MASSLSISRAARMMGTQQLRFAPMRQPTLQKRFLNLQATQRLRAVPKEEHSAHTISQRIRTLKKIPPELIPLGIVVGVAVVAAGVSIVRKLTTDKTLRLGRSDPK